MLLEQVDEPAQEEGQQGGRDGAQQDQHAAAVGIVSGWAATGLNQSVKQLSDKSFLLHTRCTPHR